MISARRLESSDLPTRVDWFNTPSVYSQMSLDVPISLSATQQWHAKAATNDARRDFCFEMRAEGDSTDRAVVVAMGGLTDIDRAAQHAELYIVVDPHRTGRGIGAPSIRWLCNYGFIGLGLARIYLHTMPHNDGARRLYSRLGFVHEGILRKHAMHQGRLVDRHVQSLLRSEWEVQEWAAEDGLALTVGP